MASSLTLEEAKQIKRRLQATAKRVAGNPKEAQRVLYAAGIVTETGELAEPYRDPTKQ